jgi:NAD(P)-dependent dehydrogenase (short-subunit alcohol dehydrogenase family)
MGQATARILGTSASHAHIQQPSIPYETYHQTDLADPASIEATAAALREVGPIHHLFNCAGIPHTNGPLKCVVVNYIGTRYLTEQLLPSLTDGAGIATISSDAGMAWQGNLPTIFELLAIGDPHEARRWCEAHPDALRFDGYSFSKEMIVVWEAGGRAGRPAGSTGHRPVPDEHRLHGADAKTSVRSTSTASPTRSSGAWRLPRSRLGRSCCSTARATRWSPAPCSTPTRASRVASSPVRSTRPSCPSSDA